jgi:hypothetical protein
LQHTTIRGRLKYTSKKPEILDKERGGETFIITLHPDGRRTLRAHCAIDENSPRVLRDCIMTVGPDWRPLETFVQITVDEAFVGSAWYRFTDTSAECEGFSQQEGRFSHRFDTGRPPNLFVTHPIQADAWHFGRFDLSKGPGEQRITEKYSCSPHHRGATGPFLQYMPEGNVYAFLGKERVTVAAGTFDALHFRLGANIDDKDMGTVRHPPYHLWLTDDGAYVTLKASVTGYMQTYYELTEYERRPGFF